MSLPRGISGAGLFIRQQSQIDPKVLKELGLDWVCVAVRMRGGRCNRSVAWYERCLEEDLVITTFDWLPSADSFDVGLPDALDFSRRVGSVGFFLNAEKEFRRKPREAEQYADACVAGAGDMTTALVSYSLPHSMRDFPWSAFAERVEIGVPEAYDREGLFLPKYPEDAVCGYQEAGFRSVIPACGIYQRDVAKGASHVFRYRTPDEVKHHLALFPPHEAIIAWPPDAHMPPLATLRALSAPPPTAE